MLVLLCSFFLPEHPSTLVAVRSLARLAAARGGEGPAGFPLAYSLLRRVATGRLLSKKGGVKERAEATAAVLEIRLLAKERAEAKRRDELEMAQEEEERKAEGLGNFAKMQWCEYDDREGGGEGKWTKCQILVVHKDDGPEKPYYTVTFLRVKEEVSGVHSGKKSDERIEKQTQLERLRRVARHSSEGRL